MEVLSVMSHDWRVEMEQEDALLCSALLVTLSFPALFPVSGPEKRLQIKSSNWSLIPHFSHTVAFRSAKHSSH